MSISGRVWYLTRLVSLIQLISSCRSQYELICMKAPSLAWPAVLVTDYGPYSFNNVRLKALKAFGIKFQLTAIAFNV